MYWCILITKLNATKTISEMLDAKQHILLKNIHVVNKLNISQIIYPKEATVLLF